MLPFEEKLKSKAKELIATQDLPNEIQAKILGEPEFRNDAKQNEACYVKLLLKSGTKNLKGEIVKEGTQLTQKYTTTTYKTLAEAIETVGGLAFAQNNFVTWVQNRIGKQQFPRFYPKQTETTTPKKR